MFKVMIMMKYFQNKWKEYNIGNKSLRIKREPELEFSIQYFQNNIPRIEFIRQKSLINFKDLIIDNPQHFAVKILTFNDEAIIARVLNSEYHEQSIKLKDSAESAFYYCFFLENKVEEIPRLAQDILNTIFDYKSSDEIEYGIKFYE